MIRMKANRKTQQAGTKAKIPIIRAEFEMENKQTFIKIGYQDKKAERRPYENVEVTYQWGCWK